jgi:hypothetical protein
MIVKNRTIVLVLVCIGSLLLTLSSCDYYDDEYISVAFDAPTEDGVISYEAGINTEKNIARLSKLEYQIEAIDNNEIAITFPQTVRSDSGKDYKIEKFGGSTGTNAPLQHFTLIINVEEEFTSEEAISLTINVGALPLDASHWADVEIRCANTVSIVPVEDIRFNSDQPLVYYLLIEEIDGNDEKSFVISPEKWYQTPNKYYPGGEKVSIKLKHPDTGAPRSLSLNNKELQPIATYDDYIEYEFIMPYYDSTLTLVDEK